MVVVALLNLTVDTKDHRPFLSSIYWYVFRRRRCEGEREGGRNTTKEVESGEIIVQLLSYCQIALSLPRYSPAASKPGDRCGSATERGNWDFRVAWRLSTDRRREVRE